MKRQRSSDATVVKVEQDVVVVEARPRVKRKENAGSRDFVIEEGAPGLGLDRGAGTGAEESSKGGGSENGRVHCKDGEESSVPIESEGRKALVGTKRTNAKREEDEKVAAAMEAASREREEGELEPEDDTTNGENEGENTVVVVVAESEPMKEDVLPVSVVDAAEVDKNSEQPPVGGVETSQFDLHLPGEQEKKVKEVEEEGNSSPQGNNLSADNFFTKLGREREETTGKEEVETRQTEKKQRVEDGAHLSLALLDTSLSLSSGDIHSRPQKQRRAHSHPSQQAPSHSRAFTDSLSLSHSLPFHHNPSCSLTQTSMDKTELSSGSQQLSYGSWQKSSQGNEGSLRKSKPVYQKALLSNPQILEGFLGRANSQVPVPFRPSSQSEDAARRAMRRKHRHGEPGEVWSSPSRSGDSRENSKGVEFTSIGVQDIVSEPIPSMARKLQELPDSFLAGLKENLREMLNSIEKREQFVQLQQTLGARKDLSTDVLLRAHRIQLELLVAVKTGILAFLHSDIPMTHSALVEVFLQQRCRNFVCQNQLPADECDCKLCAQKAGFCNSCMCVVCSKFDFDANTCRWIGCDFCLHWCHTDCGIRMSYITPGPSIRGAAGTTEMQFNCVACGHTSELYGFVKDVFCTCAPEWGRDVLARELDCVRRIFHGSTDTRGKQLCSKAEVILQQLNSQVDTAVACRTMVKFFDESSSHGATPDQLPQAAAVPLAVEAAAVPLAVEAAAAAATKKQQVTPLQTTTVSNSNKNNKQQQTTLEMAKEALATYDSELEQKRQEASELQQERERKKAQIEELESIVRIKQAEAKMFALRADEARREAEGLHRIMLAKADKIEQEYSGKLSKLGIEDAEDRCRKHRETVQVLQQAQMDFHAMNLPLLNELHELLKQLEASKRHSWK